MTFPANFGAEPLSRGHRVTLSLPFAITALVGAIGAMAVFYMAAQADGARIRNVIEFRAEWRASDFEHKLQILANSVDAAAVLLASERNPDPALFDRFAARSHRTGDTLLQLIWAPRMKRGGPDIVAGTRPGGLLDDRGGDDAFPVELEHAFAEVKPQAGLDLATDPILKSVMARSRDEARPLSTPPMPLSGTSVVGYLVLWPIYESGIVPETVEERRSRIRGFVAGVFAVARLLNAAIADTPPLIETIHFFAGRPVLPGAPAATFSPATGLVTQGGAVVSAVIPSGSLRITRTLDVFGQEWTLISEFDRAALAPMRSSEGWAFAAGVLLLTAMLLAYLAREQGYRAQVESRVAERTADLQAANAALASETGARKKAGEQLVQAQKMEAIGNLTGGMAHDFNNLLGIIIGNLDLLRDRQSGDADADEFSREALDAALRGADLTRRLLAFARRQPLQPVRTDINELIARIAKLLERTLGEQIKITLDLNPDTWPVIVDPAQLESSLTNLATNARDAMPGGGGLTIATGNRSLDADYASLHAEVQPGDYAMIAVSDSGTGMSRVVLTHIFEPFYTTKEQGKGTGLGLSMVFGFIKQSGGHINVYSEVGLGTTFRLFLRRADAGLEAGGAVVPAALVRGNGETVLAVEDNASLRRVVVRQLTELGYRVLEAEDAKTALRVLESEPVDVLFTDIVMPGGTSGYELARTVLSRWPSIKIALTSGFPENKISGDLNAPGLRLLSKPYRRDDLGRVIREALDS